MFLLWCVVINLYVNNSIQSGILSSISYSSGICFSVTIDHAVCVRFMWDGCWPDLASQVQGVFAPFRFGLFRCRFFVRLRKGGTISHQVGMIPENSEPWPVA